MPVRFATKGEYAVVVVVMIVTSEFAIKAEKMPSIAARTPKTRSPIFPAFSSCEGVRPGFPRYIRIGKTKIKADPPIAPVSVLAKPRFETNRAVAVIKIMGSTVMI